MHVYELFRRGKMINLQTPQLHAKPAFDAWLTIGHPPEHHLEPEPTILADDKGFYITTYYDEPVQTRHTHVTKLSNGESRIFRALEFQFGPHEIKITRHKEDEQVFLTDKDAIREAIPDVKLDAREMFEILISPEKQAELLSKYDPYNRSNDFPVREEKRFLANNLNQIM